MHVVLFLPRTNIKVSLPIAVVSLVYLWWLVAGCLMCMQLGEGQGTYQLLQFALPRKPPIRSPVLWSWNIL